MGIATDLTLADLEGDHDNILKSLRDHEPVCWVPALEMWLVTRWEDIEYVDSHPELFSAATEPSFLRRALGPNMLTMDPPEATRTRESMIDSFRPRGVSGRFTHDRLEDLAHEMLEPHIAAGEGDLMEFFAGRFAAQCLAEVLGIGDIGPDQMWTWCVGLCTDLANFENDPAKTALGNRAREELGSMLDERLANFDAAADERPSALRDFVMATPAGGPLTAEEIVNNVRLMISGGINEPRDGIGLVLLTYLTRPDLVKELDAAPEKWSKFVEEVFRRHSPVGTISRQATETTSIGDVVIPEGGIVSGVLRSANLDERRFENPENIDLYRTERGHAAFATGPHRCLGEWLGRQEVRLGVKVILQTLPELELAGEVEVRGFEFRGPAQLPVRWSTDRAAQR